MYLKYPYQGLAKSCQASIRQWHPHLSKQGNNTEYGKELRCSVWFSFRVHNSSNPQFLLPSILTWTAAIFFTSNRAESYWTSCIQIPVRLPGYDIIAAVIKRGSGSRLHSRHGSSLDKAVELHVGFWETDGLFRECWIARQSAESGLNLWLPQYKYSPLVDGLPTFGMEPGGQLVFRRFRWDRDPARS